jgi:hypothetical protein
MMKRLLQLILILMAAFLGYQLPNWDISFPMALIGIACYGLVSWGVLNISDRPNRA